MKYIHLYGSLLMIAFCTSYGQNQTEGKKIIKPETNAAISSPGPKSITRNIIQDRKGNIWMAAFDGIFRYDTRQPAAKRKSFTNITSKVSSARFFSVLEDSKGNLWFGSIGSGVYYYDARLNEGAGQGKPLSAGQAGFKNFTTRDGLLNNEVGSIYEDKKGNIWFGVSGGASCYDGKSFRNFIIDGNSMSEDRTGKTFPNRQPYEVNAIIEDTKGKCWFATRGNTFVYDARLNDKVGQGKTSTVFNYDFKPFKNVRSIIEDKKGNIWLGGDYGLWRYNGSTFSNFTQKFVGYIIEDKKGNIWTSSAKDSKQGWSLSRYDGKTLLNAKPTVTEIANRPMIFGILEANDGNIWFGDLNGVHRYDGKSITDFNSEK